MFNIILTFFDSFLAPLFFLKFNGYKFYEKKSIWILCPILYIISFVGNDFDLLAIICCVIISFFYMLFIELKRSSLFRCMLSSLLFYVSLMLNNTLAFSIYEICVNKEISKLVVSINNSFYVMSLLSKISLIVICLIYIYISNKTEDRNTNKFSSIMFFPFVFNMILISMCMRLYINNQIRPGVSISIIMISIFVYSIIHFYLYAKLSSKTKAEHELRIIKQKKLYEKKFFEEMQLQNQKVNTLNHDIANHFSLLQYYIVQGKYKHAIKYINEVSSKTADFKNFLVLSDETLNYIINYKIQLAQAVHISVQANIENIKRIVLSPVDLCTLLGNMMDNAIEACKKEDEKRIIIEINNIGGYQVYMIKNKINNSVLLKNSKLCTTKKESLEHGYGLKQIYQIIDLYYGHIDIYENEYFVVKAMFPIEN